ncbi:DinB family protein [compost metagenome]
MFCLIRKSYTMLQQFCSYNNWANSILLTALKEQADILPQSCINLFSHIMNAQTIWLYRINGEVPPVSVWQQHDLETCSRLLAESGQGLAAIENPDDESLPLVQYQNSTGKVFETSIPDILLHVFNHGTYHRAQIAKEMKLNGIDPVNTDYIQFVRLKS